MYTEKKIIEDEDRKVFFFNFSFYIPSHHSLVITMFWLILFWLISLCLGNTETYLFKIPQYYDIVSHPTVIATNDKFTRHVHYLNDTHRLILDYPIQTIDNIDISNIVKLNYDTVSQLPSTLLVRINNYGNALISNEDLLNIKLCWPATTPYDFQISHGYFHSNEISEELEDNLELYLIINYQFHAYTYDETKYLNSNDELEFQLYINKIPNKYLPIPLELYDFIVYLVDITIFLSWNVVPYLVHSFFL